MLQQITYWKVKKPPTLNQYLHRRFVREMMKAQKGTMKGVGLGVEGKRRPKSALLARDALTGLTSTEIAKKHPEWIEEYKKAYPTTQP